MALLDIIVTHWNEEWCEGRKFFEMLKMQLMAFRGDMQQEMATDLVIFAHDHLAYTTGCPSADMVLDVCYSWIAHEQGLLKVNFSDYQDEAGV